MLIDLTSVRNFVESDSFEFDPVVLVDFTSFVALRSLPPTRDLVALEPLEPEAVALVLSASTRNNRTHVKVWIYSFCRVKNRNRREESKEVKLCAIRGSNLIAFAYG